MNTYFGGSDQPQGKLISPPFTIERPWIGFLIGGGQHAEKTCINLLVDGQVVRTATGLDREQLQPHDWNVKDLFGKEARLEIVDAASGGWGHVNVDQIEFRDEPMSDAKPLRRRADFGTMVLAVLDDQGTFARTSLPAGDRLQQLFAGDPAAAEDVARKCRSISLSAARSARRCKLDPGAEATIAFVITWHMPNNYRENRWVGNYYAKQFRNAMRCGPLRRPTTSNGSPVKPAAGTTRTTTQPCPRWLLERIGATVCNLATGTCQWWRNGRFWAWEGVGCCHGTCGHVWNYEHAMARLFPELERSVRTMQDFAPGIGFDPQTGAIGFRGEDWTLWAGDAQGGYILKAYREHQCSPDDAVPEPELAEHSPGDPVPDRPGRKRRRTDRRHANIKPTTRTITAQTPSSARCIWVPYEPRRKWPARWATPTLPASAAQFFEAGRDNSVKRLFNGEYFAQDVDLEQHPEWQYADGCLADQMFGQGWAHQVALGYLYPKETVLKSLASIWKYCWAPDVSIQNKHHDPERWFAVPGEAGLFTCTWPKSKHLGREFHSLSRRGLDGNRVPGRGASGLGGHAHRMSGHLPRRARSLSPRKTQSV